MRKFLKGLWRVVKGVVGLSLILATILGIYAWEVYGREKLLFQNVIVARDVIKAGAIIDSKDLVRTVAFDTRTLGGGFYDESKVNEIVGKVALVEIPEGGIVYNTMLVSDELYPNEGEFTFRIPAEWVVTYPSTVRRGDLLSVYPYKGVLQTTGGGTTKSSYNVSESKFITQLRIVYAKDSASKEVRSDRFDSASSVAVVEVFVTLEQLNTLRSWVSQGYKFIFVYE